MKTMSRTIPVTLEEDEAEESTQSGRAEGEAEEVESRRELAAEESLEPMAAFMLVS